MIIDSPGGTCFWREGTAYVLRTIYLLDIMLTKEQKKEEKSKEK